MEVHARISILCASVLLVVRSVSTIHLLERNAHCRTAYGIQIRYAISANDGEFSGVTETYAKMGKQLNWIILFRCPLRVVVKINQLRRS